MATSREKVAAEQEVRAMLEGQGLPQPDDIQYGDTCVRLLWHEEKMVVILDIDESPPEPPFDPDQPLDEDRDPPDRPE